MIGWSTSDLAGLEFGDGYVTAVRLRRKQDRSPVLTHAGWIDHDPAANPKAVADAVRALWRQAAIPTRTVCASLRSASMVMRYFAVPSMTDEELKKTLSLQAEEALQMSGDKLVVEWHAQPRSDVDAVSAAISGVLVAAPRHDVERELEILDLAGLDPAILDMRGLAVMNLFSKLQPNYESAPLCLISVSPHAADIMVRQAAGRFYPHTTYCRASTWGEAPGFLVGNVRDVLRYCEYKLGWEPVSRIFLTGELLPGDPLVGAMASELKLEVSRWNPISDIRVQSGRVERFLAEAKHKAGLLGPAMGMAIRSE